MYDWAQSKQLGQVTELTMLTPIRQGFVPGERRTYEERLRSVLENIAQRAKDGIPTPIGRIPTIHYARWFILRPEQYLQHSRIAGLAYDAGDDIRTAVPKAYDDYLEAEADDTPILPSWLAFCSNFDGDLKAYLREFSAFIADDLDRVWGNCENYPGAADFEAFWAYTKRYQVPCDAFYGSYPELSVPRIKQLQLFKQRFDAFIARTRDADGSSIPEVGALLDQFLQENRAYTHDFPAVGGLYEFDQRRGDDR